jgi:hypothetical protein
MASASLIFALTSILGTPNQSTTAETNQQNYDTGPDECRSELDKGHYVYSVASWPPGVSLVYSPMTQIMRPIRLKEFIEHWSGGPIREAFGREVRGYRYRLVLPFVRGRVNRLGRVSCLGDRGSIFHILSVSEMPTSGEEVFPLMTRKYALSGADIPSSK